jgi:hypothetical protein
MINSANAKRVYIIQEIVFSGIESAEDITYDGVFTYVFERISDEIIASRKKTNATIAPTTTAA